MMHTLEADGIMLEFGTRKILTDVYLKCETGSITGLLGRNGQGKTCLMNIIYGNLAASSKSVRFDQVPVHDAYRKAHLLQYLPQFHFIPGALSLKQVFSDFELDFTAFCKRFPEYSSKYRYRIKDLSGGERRLVEVYAIIMSGAQFAMLDEPFSHLAPVQVERVKQLLLDEKHRKGFLITDHLYRHITDISACIYILSDGKVHRVNNSQDFAALGYTRS